MKQCSMLKTQAMYKKVVEGCPLIVAVLSRGITKWEQRNADGQRSSMNAGEIRNGIKEWHIRNIHQEISGDKKSQPLSGNKMWEPPQLRSEIQMKIGVCGSNSCQ